MENELFKLNHQIASPTIEIEPYQCPARQLTQGPIHEIFMKKYWELVELENEFFFSRPFWFFSFEKKKKNCFTAIKICESL